MLKALHLSTCCRCANVRVGNRALSRLVILSNASLIPVGQVQSFVSRVRRWGRTHTPCHPPVYHPWDDPSCQPSAISHHHLSNRLPYAVIFDFFLVHLSARAGVSHAPLLLARCLGLSLRYGRQSFRMREEDSDKTFLLISPVCLVPSRVAILLVAPAWPARI